MITFDLDQGTIKDHGEVWVGECESGESVVVTVAVTEDEELAVSYKDTTVYVPLERVRKLLEKIG